MCFLGSSEETFMEMIGEEEVVFVEVVGGLVQEVVDGSSLEVEVVVVISEEEEDLFCLLYTSPSPRDQRGSRMPSSA